MSTASYHPQTQGLGANPNHPAVASTVPAVVAPVSPASPVHNWLRTLSAVGAAITFLVAQFTGSSSTPAPAPVSEPVTAKTAAAALPGTPLAVAPTTHQAVATAATMPVAPADPNCPGYLEIIKTLLADRQSTVAASVIPPTNPVAPAAPPLAYYQSQPRPKMITPESPSSGYGAVGAATTDEAKQAVAEIQRAYISALNDITAAMRAGQNSRVALEQMAVSTFSTQLKAAP